MADRNNDVATAGTYTLDGGPEMSRAQRRSSLIAALVLLAAGIFTLKGFLSALRPWLKN